jgi:hypothetical protein
MKPLCWSVVVQFVVRSVRDKMERLFHSPFAAHLFPHFLVDMGPDENFSLGEKVTLLLKRPSIRFPGCCFCWMMVLLDRSFSVVFA